MWRYILAGMIVVGVASAARAEGPALPFFVDLSAAANAGFEDDGVAGNGKGGWSDEGVNDMFIYPPVALGDVVRNGYRFRTLDPAANGGRAVVMLKGGTRGVDKPETVRIEVPGVKGRYLYFLQNSTAGAPGQPSNYVVATYTLAYADGTTAQIPVRDGIEIRPWWAGQWYDNSGAASWPIFMGRNLYSMKWHRYIGVWAMQWENPKPAQPITGITLQSAGTAVPAVWAVTIDDADYYRGPDVKKDYVRPADAPAGYFAAKVEQERAAVYAAAKAQGLLQGVRRIELIRSDLLAVTVDAALGRIGPGPGLGVIEPLQAPGTFAVSSATDDAFKTGLAPAKVGRHTFEGWMGDIGTFPANTLYLHTFYLALPQPLKSGHTYRVSVRGIEPEFTSVVELAYDEAATATPAIKVNQAAYSLKSARRYAYVGWWAGDLGKVDYGMLKTFRVIDEKTGDVVQTGSLTLRKADDELSGEDVYELDLSALKTAGTYHVQVPGLGRSDTFALGGAGIGALYRDTLRVFYHQRCGLELKQPYTTFERPACHVDVYESGYLVGHPSYVPKAGEATRAFRGGYHDAADYDCFTYHLRATAQALTAYAQAPEVFRDGDLNIPESGNRIPDLLDEAEWALAFYRDNPLPDGSIPKGRGNDQDAIRAWESQHKSRPAFGLFPPTSLSCSEFAATAALYARLLRPFDAARADATVAAAGKAYEWAKAHPTQPEPERGEALFLAWAAAELFATTGLAAFNEDFLRFHREGALTKFHWQLAQYAPLCWWPYAVCRQPGVDPAVQAALKQAIIKRADDIVGSTEKPAYRMGNGGGRGLGWGNGNGGGHFADPCLRAYWLTGEQKYVDTACLNADFQLGANALSRTFISATGARFPRQPQISDELYTGPRKTGQTVKGIPNYGLQSDDPPGYPAGVPPFRRARDIGGGAEVSSEFTITETVGAAAILYGSLHALESGPVP